MLHLVFLIKNLPPEESPKNKKVFSEATIFVLGTSLVKAFIMVQKTKSRRLIKIGRVFLQSIFYVGSIVLMVYVGYSKNKDRDWSLIKGIQEDHKNQKIESSVLSSDSTNFTVSWTGFLDIQSNQVLDK